VASPPLIRLDDALANVTALGFDTAPFIYFVERHPAYVALMRDVFGRVDAGRISGYSSVITLTEVLTRPRQEGNTTIATAYRSLLLGSRNFTLLSINPTIADAAAELRARYGLHTPDALQIAASISAGCQAFLTNDAALRRVTEVRVLLLDELEV
jgi:predicted nucleic acid-binding protein